MSISPVQARIIANTEPFTTMLSELLVKLAPLLRSLSLAKQRHRSRLVTRNKQRRNW